MTSDPFDEWQLRIEALLEQAEWGRIFTWQPLAGGRNNRVYRVATDRGELLLKRYFSDPRDPRPRLATEFAFCEFCWQSGLRWTPQPLACDAASQLALYEFIPGRQLDAGEVTAAHVTSAVQFFTELNQLRTRAQAATLPTASEACFRVTDHLELVDQRVQRLARIDAATSDVHAQASRFVSDDLRPAWQQLRRDILAEAARRSVNPDAELPPADRCLSPSDFGFHNAIVQPDGKLRFIDFEYAGWDDPAKLVGDFYSQPKVAVPRQTQDAFLEAVTAASNDATAVRERARLLGPVYQLKWCCIALNELLPVDRVRRDFSGSGVSHLHLARQLALARQKLGQVAF